MTLVNACDAYFWPSPFYIQENSSILCPPFPPLTHTHTVPRGETKRALPAAERRRIY